MNGENFNIKTVDWQKKKLETMSFKILSYRLSIEYPTLHKFVRF
jgi:hypothetical protein